MAGLSDQDEETDKKGMTADKALEEGLEKQNEEENEEPALQSATTRKRAKLSDHVHRMILDAIASHSRCLDLSRKELKTIPKELLDCQSLQYLYLEGNQLVNLPENFFDCLPNLQWLDLRQNYLTSIPSAYIGRHQHLKNILLEGNELRTLPLELGLVATLNGLNIANNPLDFPPQEIIEGGTQNILAFFREMLRAKSQGRALPVSRLEEFNGHGEDASSESDGEGHGHLHHKHNGLLKSIPTKDSRSHVYGSHDEDSDLVGPVPQSASLHKPSIPTKDSRSHMYGSHDEDSDLVGPVPQSASLHKPVSYQEIRQMQMDRLEKAGVLHPGGSTSAGHGGKKKTHSKKSGKRLARRPVDVYPDAPGPELVEQRYLEERRISRLRDLKEKQDLILQRRKDADKLQKFRDDGKRLQREKLMEKMRNGGRLEYEEPVKKAPFEVSKEDMRMISNEERIAQDIKAKHEKIRQRPMSPSTLQRMEDARAERDRELERRIKKHTESMQERRRKPKGTPQQEMDAAMRELQVAEALQREIEGRRKEMEYRFTAFNIDPVPYSLQKPPPPRTNNQ